MEIHDLKEIAKNLLSKAEKGEEVEVCCSHASTTEVEVHDSHLESLTNSVKDGIGIRIVNQGKQGFASAGSFATEAIDAAFQEARDNTQFSEPDEFISITKDDGVTPVIQDNWDHKVIERDTKEKIAFTIELEKKALSLDKRIIGARSTAYSDGFSHVVLLNSNGIEVSESSTHAGSMIQVMSSDGNEMRSGFGYDGGKSYLDIDEEYILDQSVGRALKMLGSKKPPSQKVDLFLDPENASTYFELVASMLNGESVVKGITPFATRLGESIAVPNLNLFDDATDPESKGCQTYDGEGLSTRKVNLIENGILRGFLHDTYTAKRFGTDSTASAQRSTRGLPSPGAHALHLSPGNGGTDEQIISQISNGVYVYDFAGLHSGVNVVSGDLSLGVEGVMIRDGEVAESISECTISSTIQRMLLDVATVSSEVKSVYSGALMPSVVIPNIALSGE